MRRLFLLLMLLSLYACSKNEEETPLVQGLPQIWQLSRLTIGLTGEVLMGQELPYQETLLLAADSTFLKTRTDADMVTTASGTFEIVPFDGANFLILTHTERTGLLANCSNTLQERFRMDSTTNLSGGALPCDGPGLAFERVK